MQLDGAFRVLLIPLLLMVDCSSGIVPPPTNLTLSCYNFNVTARWEYSHPNARFRVNVREDFWANETTNHYFDLSPYVWEPGKHLDVHFVSISAILGENQSEPLVSETLAYYDQKTTHIKCNLSFPPVDLEVVNEEGVVTFQNPLHFYDYLHAVKSPTAVFYFYVILEDGKTIEGECMSKKCQQEILLPEDKPQCVNLTGKLCDQPGRLCVKFNKTGPICPEVSSDLPWIVFGVLLLGVIIIVSVITILICQTQSWTFKKEEPTPPKPLVLPVKNNWKAYIIPDKNDYSTVMLVDNKTCEMSSASLDKESLHDSGDSSCASSATSLGSGYRRGSSLDNSKEEQEPDSRSKTESVLIDSEAYRLEAYRVEAEELQEMSPYDCPHYHITDTTKGS